MYVQLDRSRSLDWAHSLARRKIMRRSTHSIHAIDFYIKFCTSTLTLTDLPSGICLQQMSVCLNFNTVGTSQFSCFPGLLNKLKWFMMLNSLAKIFPKSLNLLSWENSSMALCESQSYKPVQDGIRWFEERVGTRVWELMPLTLLQLLQAHHSSSFELRRWENCGKSTISLPAGLWKK